MKQRAIEWAVIGLSVLTIAIIVTLVCRACSTWYWNRKAAEQTALIADVEAHHTTNEINPFLQQVATNK